MKLHLGCGKLLLEGYTNIDLASKADVCHDIKSFEDMYDNNTIDEIYICHVLEHFSRREIINVLTEYNRILKLGGTLRIAVPDFDAVIDMYNSDKRNVYDLMGLLYGGQRNELDYHKIVFTFDTLKNVLECCGFTDVAKYDAWEFLGETLDDYSKSYLPHMDRINGKLVSLNVICKKCREPMNEPNNELKRLFKL